MISLAPGEVPIRKLYVSIDCGVRSSEDPFQENVIADPETPAETFVGALGFSFIGEVLL